MKIPFLDLKDQYKEIRQEVNTAIKRVINRQFFILGEEVENFESQYAKYLGSKYVCGLNSGTDALILALKALEIGPGDEVITTPLTFIATTLAISEVGAIPVFVDINPETYQIDVDAIEAKINKKTKAILPVHLYGAPCDVEKIVKIAKKYHLKVIEDACQAHGAKLNGRKLGTFGDIGAFSFYPGKNLGAYGDGGAICTNDHKLYEKIRRLRNYGQRVKYFHDEIGYNSRLDEIQAAILAIKIRYLDRWNKRRNQAANIYQQGLPGVKMQKIIDGGQSCYHVFAIESADRDGLIKFLADHYVGALVHYPLPIHLQKCYHYLGYRAGDFPKAEKACERLVSLPIFAELGEEKIKRVAILVREFEKLN